MAKEQQDKIFKTKISFAWAALDGTDNGHVEIANNVVNRQGRYAMEEALSAEILRWGKASLLAHGIEPIPLEKYEVKRS